MGLEGGRPSLHDLSMRYLDRPLDKTVREHFIGADPATYRPTADDLDYAALDAEVVVPIYQEQARALVRDGLVRGTLLRMSMIPIVGDMELEGAPLDVSRWSSVVERLEADLATRETLLVEELTPHVVTARAAEYTRALAEREAWEQAHAQAKQAHEGLVAVRGGAEPEAYDPDGVMTVMVDSKQQRRERINALNRDWKARWEATHGKAPAIPRLEHGPINLGSWQQLQAAYAQLGITLPSTEAAELERIADEHPTVRPLLEWKKLTKLVGTYGRPLLEKVVRHPDGTDRIHPQFNLVVSTGRMSCRAPNLQNCPPSLREAFTAPEGWRFVLADFSQIELRICADLSNDPNMIQTFVDGQDLHLATAARRLGLTYQEALTRKQRGDAKVLDWRHKAKIANFSVLYGKQDAELVALFSTAYPDAWAWLQQQGELGWQRGYTVSASGLRRRYANRFPPTLNRGQQWSYRAHIERAAMNHPIQGTSADITMAAALAVREQLGQQLFLWNLVHDELDGLAHADLAQAVAEATRRLCIEAGRSFLTRVPIEVDVHVNRTWSKEL